MDLFAASKHDGQPLSGAKHGHHIVVVAISQANAGAIPRPIAVLHDADKA